MSTPMNRRIFLRQLLATVGGAAAFSSVVSLTGCSTFDEYLFEDHYDLKDQVLIIGGGLSGLQMAYLLKQNKTEFRLFEGASRFGGRVRSSGSFDLGGSLFSPDNEKLRLLLKQFSIATDTIDKKTWYAPAGMESVVNELVARISGLMPYRNMRLSWKLLSIRKKNTAFELTFETPRGQRTFVSQRIVIATPPSQWARVQGLLELEEMQAARGWGNSLQTQNILRAVIPVGGPAKFQAAGQKMGLQSYEDASFSVRQVYKKSKGLAWNEIDFQFHGGGNSIEIQKLNDFMKRKMALNVNYTKLTTENYFDWRETALIGGAYFKNPVAWKTLPYSNFQVVGDFASPRFPSTMEGALESAYAASEKIL